MLCCFFSSSRKCCSVSQTNVLLVWLLMVVTLPVALGQTMKTDDNLNRLEEAVNAINQNRLPHAEEILNSLLAKSPNDTDAWNLLGVVRAKQDRTGDAEQMFRRAILIS